MTLSLPAIVFGDCLTFLSRQDHERLISLSVETRSGALCTLVATHGHSLHGSQILTKMRKAMKSNLSFGCLVAAWRTAARTSLRKFLPILWKTCDWDNVWATIAAVATGNESELQLLEEANLAGEDIPFVLARAVQVECERSCKAGDAPQMEWIVAWCQLGARFSGAPKWMATQEYPECMPLDDLAQSTANLSDLVEVVNLLVSHGSLASAELVVDAWHRARDTSSSHVRWKALWCDVAADVAVHILDVDKRHQYNKESLWSNMRARNTADDLEQLLSIGLHGAVFHNALRVVARENMRSEDYRWE